MDANEFIVKLKADGSAEDWLDLDEAYKQYQCISAKLSSGDRVLFAVNVLCILCRNIEKVQSWPSAVDLKVLLSLAIDCVRCTRGADEGHRARTLVCVYHLQRFVVRQTTQKLPPELIIKISYMPFENTAETLIKDHYRTYWNILADRLAYIEKLKAQNMAIIKLFSKLVDDISKLIEIYNTVPFCNTVLAFLIAKLHSIYSECHSKELNNTFGKIFLNLSLKSDVIEFKTMTETQSLDLYTKFNECFCVIAENSAKNNFEESVLSNVVRSCVTMLGHFPEIWHCLHTFYLNGFCMILTGNTDGNYTRNILKNICITCENTTKLGYTKALMATFPFINQLLRLYIEYFVTNNKLWSKHFDIQVQESCLDIITLLIKNLKKCNQQIKCENCKVRTGQHDALRLSFLVKNFLSLSLQEKMDVTKILPSFTKIVLEQYSIVKQLCTLGCSSYDKYYKKLQTDIHNSAILLYKAEHYDFSIKLFDLYLSNEIKHFKSESELKNISRALYNKSICELDCKLHENALKDAYLSLVFAHPESLNSEKYMSLVMDIKAKALKHHNAEESDNKSQNSDKSNCKSENEDRIDKKSQTTGENDDTEKRNNKSNSAKSKNNKSNSAESKHNKSNSTEIKNNKSTIAETKNNNSNTSDKIDSSNADDLQLMTVLDACQSCVDSNYYGNLKPFFCNLKFSVLLKHEFAMYAKLWPAIQPAAGVWRGLLRLHRGEVAWSTVKEESTSQILIETILETTNTVRTIHNAHMSHVVKQLVEDLVKCQNKTVEMHLAYASILFIKAEYDLQEASDKFGWKTEMIQDEDSQPNRTIEQEHEALASAVSAVRIWIEVGRSVDTVPISPLVRLSLQCAAQSVPLLLRLNKMAEGLSLAHVCCALASRMDDKVTQVRLASTLLSHACSSSAQLESIVSGAKVHWRHLVASSDSVDVALGFLCELAMYYCRTGKVAVSAKLVQLCQAYSLHAYNTYPDIKLDIPVGRLLVAQSLLCADRENAFEAQSSLSAVNGVQRHCSSASTAGSTWSTRRLISSTVRHLATSAGIAACARAKAALLLRRARQAALAAQVNAPAAALAKLSALTANTHCTDDTQVKIDNRLKYILGLPSNDTLCTQSIVSNKQPLFTPKHEIETMLESMTFKQTQLSPSLPSKIPGFKTPDFLTHDRKCQCHNCQNPVTFVLTCQTVGLEASMYFRAKEFEIARNYFEGCIKCFSFAESKLKSLLKMYRDLYENYIVDIVEKILWDDLRYAQLQVLIEHAFFELSQTNYREADEIIVTIHEILREYKDIDLYMRNEVLNLLAVTAKLRKPTKVPQITELEVEMDKLKLSPRVDTVEIEPPKTPEDKAKNPPIITRKIVPDEEIPNVKRRVIKLDLDDDDSNKEREEKTEREISKRSSRRGVKVPSPKLPRPELEIMTPMPKTCKKRGKATSLDENTDTAYNFATPQPKNGGKKLNNAIKDLNVQNLEFATPMPKTESKRALTRSKTVEVTDENSYIIEKSSSKTDTVSVLDFATPKPRADSRRTLTKSKTIRENNDSFIDRSKTAETTISVLEKTDYATPKPNVKSDDFFTPVETPADQFFTPIASVKTYAKKSLRHGIIKNLENEFSTPRIVVSNENLDTNQTNLDPANPSVSKSRSRKVETGSVKALKDKRSLKRATSPGKLEKSEKKAAPKLERATRLRKPVRFSVESVDEDAE